jgi:hypothetical protein
MHKCKQSVAETSVERMNEARVRTRDRSKMRSATKISHMTVYVVGIYWAAPQKTVISEVR